MKIWITGSNGVLGSAVLAVAKAKGHEAIGTTRWECPVDSLGIAVRTAQTIGPDAIINCAGALPGRQALETVLANAVGPHILAVLAQRGVRVVNMSTDCVFSGLQSSHSGRLSSEHLPDPVDLYGRTKLTGEVMAPNILNVRGSFISKEAGFLHWLRNAEGRVDAWDNATWTGTTVEVMAETLVALAESDREGVVHAASPTMTTKGWMVEMFVGELGLPLAIQHKKEPRLFRALQPDIELPSVEKTLTAYAKEIAA